MARTRGGTVTQQGGRVRNATASNAARGLDATGRRVRINRDRFMNDGGSDTRSGQGGKS